MQIIYLDNLDFGSSKTRQFSRPRVADFSCTVFDKLISLDTDITSTNDNFNFGITEVNILSIHSFLCLQLLHLIKCLSGYYLDHLDASSKGVYLHTRYVLSWRIG
jgi:hypothetical protein